MKNPPEGNLAEFLNRNARLREEREPDIPTISKLRQEQSSDFTVYVTVPFLPFGTLHGNPRRPRPMPGWGRFFC